MNLITSNCNITAAQATVISDNAAFYTQLNTIAAGIYTASIGGAKLYNFAGALLATVQAALERKLFTVTEITPAVSYDITWS